MALRTAPPPNLSFVYQGSKIDADIMHGAMGVCTEGGELLDAVKKLSFYSKPLDVSNVVEELGDVLWYLAVACRGCGVSLDDVATVNIAKLRKRYPEEFAKGRAINRDVEAEAEVIGAALRRRSEQAEAVQARGREEEKVGAAVARVVALFGDAPAFPFTEDTTPLARQGKRQHPGITRRELYALIFEAGCLAARRSVGWGDSLEFADNLLEQVYGVK